MRADTLSDVPDLRRSVLGLISQVPGGRVTTYGHVARALGDLAASRYVAIVASEPDRSQKAQCARVVHSDGSVARVGHRGLRESLAFFEADGVRVRDGKVAEFDKLLFTDFVSDSPLAELRSRQRALRRFVREPTRRVPVRHVAGVDVAYSGGRGYAAAAIYDYSTGELVDRLVHEGRARFPYIPTYLAFRELPLVMPLMDDLPRHTVLMYDGNGVLHPEAMGIATHAGIAFGIPTIGVAKSLLCGRLDKPRRDGSVPVLVGRRVAGFELLGPGSRKPVYVSVGHGIGQRQALEVAKRFLWHRVPEPTRVAHIVAARARRGTSHK